MLFQLGRVRSTVNTANDLDKKASIGGSTARHTHELTDIIDSVAVVAQLVEQLIRNQ